MDILIVEPYFTGSHAAWAEGYKKASRHNVEILSLEGRFWKWRMHGGAVTLAREFLERGRTPDLILATDMLDLTTFLSLTRKKTAGIPAAVYFHENQLTYPWHPCDRDVAQNRDRHYGFINYASALAADEVFFNSRFHMDSFLAALEGLLRGFPEYNETASVDAIRSRSSALPLGMDFTPFDAAQEHAAGRGGPPLILWNHRWEHDKNPGEFFDALYALDGRGLDFRVALLGENFRNRPVEFDEAARRLGKKIVHSGFVGDRAQYAAHLARADIVPVTSLHDFFGCSVVEAMRSDCFPILPARLAYPEHIPGELRERFLYDGFTDLVERLEWAVRNIEEVRSVRTRGLVERYGWPAMARVYDARMESAAGADTGRRTDPCATGGGRGEAKPC
ncbi:MAG: DUF3524 domain-containing protein [Thermodesulfobacteriota bacterium]